MDFKTDFNKLTLTSAPPTFAMVGCSRTRTRNPSGGHLTNLVGPGKEFLRSEVPTVRAAIQKGILVKEKMMIEQCAKNKGIMLKEILIPLIPLIQAQWMKADTKFSPHVTSQEHGILLELERYWKRVDEVAKGKGNQAERKKVLDLLDRLFDITTSSCYVMSKILTAKIRRSVK